jgi:hypothetical protein
LHPSTPLTKPLQETAVTRGASNPDGKTSLNQNPIIRIDGKPYTVNAEGDLAPVEEDVSPPRHDAAPPSERRVIYRQSGDTDVTITAFQDEEGCAGISGQDFGDGPLQYVGEDEYEYSVTIAREDVPRLRTFLEERIAQEHGRKPNPGLSVVALLEAAFGGRGDAVSALDRALQEQGIPASFWSWP